MLLGIIPLRISAYWVIGVFIVHRSSWNLGSASKSEVAYWCHFGGMLAGAVLFPLMKPRRRAAVRMHAPRRTPVVQIGPARPPRASELDRIR